MLPHRSLTTGRSSWRRAANSVAVALRLVRALAAEMYENWLEATRCLNMDHLKKHKKEVLRALGCQTEPAVRSAFAEPDAHNA
jgi:hypothetical protein